MTVNTNNTTHEVLLTPRYFPCNIIEVHVKDSFKGIDTIVECNYEERNNLLVVIFDYNFEDESNYQIKIIDANSQDLVFRGELLSTTQETQQYSVTNNRYNWN